MRKDQRRTNIRRAALILVAGIITASCSEKSALNRENDANTPETARESEIKTAQDADEQQPDQDQIEQDCAALVSFTKITPARSAATNCPTCPAAGAAILAFRGMKTEAVSCSGDTCTVIATIRAVYNPGSGERIGGGLTAWISPEQRSAYLSGHMPSGDQTYRVKITYKHRDAAWRAIEFDRAPAE